MECPGDIITYMCYVETNSENPQVSWRITLPGNNMSEGITYNGSSILGLVDINPEGFARVTLLEFSNASALDTIIESIFEVVLLPDDADVPLNQTFLECFSENLSNDSLYVNVNLAGNLSNKYKYWLVATMHYFVRYCKCS